jgi:hypothetical protein
MQQETSETTHQSRKQGTQRPQRTQKKQFLVTVYLIRVAPWKPVFCKIWGQVVVKERSLWADSWSTRGPRGDFVVNAWSMSGSGHQWSPSSSATRDQTSAALTHELTPHADLNSFHIPGGPTFWSLETTRWPQIYTNNKTRQTPSDKKRVPS